MMDMPGERAWPGGGADMLVMSEGGGMAFCAREGVGATGGFSLSDVFRPCICVTRIYVSFPLDDSGLVLYGVVL